MKLIKNNKEKQWWLNEEDRRYIKNYRYQTKMYSIIFLLMGLILILVSILHK